VIFIHGAGLGSNTWDPMRRAFRAAGYPEQWLKAVDLHPNDGSNAAAAESIIAPAVEDLLAEAQRLSTQSGCIAPTKVDVVAHSMGAVSARWYIARIDATRVRNLVGIAPANHGSDALCGIGGEGPRELCPAFARDAAANALQVALNGTAAAPVDETPFGPESDRPGVPVVPPDDARRVNYVTIRLDPDQWIQPAGSAMLDGAGGLVLRDIGGTLTSPGNVLWPQGVSHDDLPREPQLIRGIIASLREDR
jgi:pimeloyl-ACP methyl ester carboxylesterase